MVRSASLSCLMFVVAAASCGDNGTEPPVGPPGLTIVSGAGANDTIDARLVQALVVEVHTPAGRGVPNAVVRFTSLSARRPDGWTTPGVLVGRLTDATLTSLVVDTTDANSRATALVQLGSVAGETGVEVTVPVLGLVDTARYRVRPGATDSVALTPLDTAVYVGASYAISGRTLDRHGNATDGTVVLTVGDITVAEVAAASVTGRAYGRTAVVASSGPVRDTAWTSVVPTGVLAVTGYGGVIATVNLDGSGYRQIPVPRTYTGAGIAWAPDGSYLVAGFDDPRTLYRVTTDGGSTRLIAGAAPSVGEITAVDVSADGQETYFSAGYCNYNEVVYRVLGTDAYPVRVSAPVADECFGLVQANVSLSPDGAHAAVEHYGTPYDTPDVQILALASGAQYLLDGADPAHIEGLLQAGKLPFLGRLKASGAWGLLTGERPIETFANVATIATGRPRSVHHVVRRASPGHPTANGSSRVTSLFLGTLPALWSCSVSPPGK